MHKKSASITFPNHIKMKTTETAWEIRSFGVEMLQQRVCTMYENAHKQNFLKVLKCVNITMHNLTHANLYNISKDDAAIYKQCLYSIGELAIQRDAASIKKLLWNMYYDMDFRSIRLNNVPDSVRLCYERVLCHE